MDRRLNGGEHVVLHRRNRALVEGRTNRLRVDPDEWVWFAPALVGCLLLVWLGWRTGGLLGAVLAVSFLGTAALLTALTASVFRERSRCQHKARLLTGEVTSVDEVRVKVENVGYMPGAAKYFWSRRLMIAYRFVTPAGEECADVVMSLPPRRRRARPAPGDQLAVLYVERSRHALIRLAPQSASPRKNLLEAMVARWRLNRSGVAPAGYASSWKAHHQVM